MQAVDDDLNERMDPDEDENELQIGDKSLMLTYTQKKKENMTTKQE